MKLSDYVVTTIKEMTGNDTVFLLTGGMAMHLDDSFGKFMHVIPCHHEQAAGIAASCFARIRGVTGVVCVTAGPGALNAVTACGGAYLESIPMVFVSGQVSRANGRQGHPVRQRGVQEIEIVDVVEKITKYAVKVEEPSSIRYHLKKALFLATTGRPGPVWLDIPVDVQGAEVDPEKMESFHSPIPSELSMDQRDKDAIRCVASGLFHAKRPLIVLGGGVRLAGAKPLIRDFIEKAGLPFQTSWNGMDLISTDHPLCFGRANVFGPRYANILIQDADYVLFIGCRLGIQHTGYNVEAFVRGAHVVAVDVDRSEMEKPGLHVDEKLVMDARVFMEILEKDFPLVQDKVDISSWIRKCQAVKKRFPIAPELKAIKNDAYVHPQYFIDELSRLLPDGAMFPFGSSGMGHTVTGGIFRCKDNQRIFTFKGLAGMGYGIPCVVGAAVACPDKIALTLVGEGGLQLNIQELQTAWTNHLHIKVIVFNNGGYHSIHMTQTNYFAKHFVGSGAESGVTFPPLDEVASLYRMHYYQVKDNPSVDAKIKQFLDDPEASFLEVFLDPAKPLEPKCASMKLPSGEMVSRPLEDMLPLLDRKELQDIMDIPILG
jgi:acetolactate synthase-1/2/3 large subunit